MLIPCKVFIAKFQKQPVDFRPVTFGVKIE